MGVRDTAVFLVWRYVRLCYNHKVYGTEHLPSGGAIVASNHSSYLDPPILGVSCPHEVHFLARASLFRFAPFAWLLRKLLTHPVVKGRENVSTFKKACELVLSGKKIAIFPEGSRSRTGELQKGKLGVGVLVLRTKALVIPTYVHGTHGAWRAGKSLPSLKGKTACVFGRPLDFSSLDTKERKECQQEIADSIMEAIAALQKWYEAGAKGSPP